jgi:hypothetical protein
MASLARRTWLAATLLAAGACGGRPLPLPDARVDGPGRDTAAPDAGTPARQLVAGPVRLVGTHLDVCSQGRGHHWCAFSRADAAGGKTALWVIDVTQAAAGAVPACDGTDPGCLRLTTDLWTGRPSSGPAHPTAHRFSGDTLIFHAQGPASHDEYRGPIFAWRPGWPAARLISGPSAYSCLAHPDGQAAYCFEDLAPPSEPLFHFDLHGGRLGDGPLPLLSRIVPRRTGSLVTQWAAGWSPAGDFLAYSTGGATSGEPEVLRVVRTDDAAFPERQITAARGVSRWQISGDGRHWYFLRGYNYDPDAPAGTLARADFPSGAGETALAAGVGSFVFAGTGQPAIGLTDGMSGGAGTFKLMRDVAQPAVVQTVASGVISAALSPDLRFSLVSQTNGPSRWTKDAYLVANDGSGRCPLASSPSASFYGDPFFPHAGLVLWADMIDIDILAGTGWMARPDGCTAKREFGHRVDYWFLVRDDGAIFSDGSNGNTADLRYVKLGPGALWPGEAAPLIQAQARRAFAVVEPDRDFVLYVLDNGLYLYGPIGFGKP